MKDYVRISLETHLFFARIMKEHALFLQAGFVGKDNEWIRRADSFRRQFENLLAQVVQISNRMISRNVLKSNELATEFTFAAERKTSELSGLPIDSRITRAERNLECANNFEASREMVQMVQNINERAVWLLNGMIPFQERLLEEVRNCNTFTANYPLLIEHITREARLYRETIQSLMREPRCCRSKLIRQEEFWNRIMMEHALFIRGLLDPAEEKLICTADDFAHDFKRLLEQARRQDSRACEGRTSERRNIETREVERCNRDTRENDCRNCNNREMDCHNHDNRDSDFHNCDTCDDFRGRDNRDARSDDFRGRDNRDARRDDFRGRDNRDARRDDWHDHDDTLTKTMQLRDFKAAGTEGILKCQIQSIMLPLLADHVLREANHYIRILEHGFEWQED